jgi:monovalent cation/hydrogen antiporter
VLLTTLVLPGLTLPWLMKKLDLAESPAMEREAEEVLAQRAQEASLSALRSSPVMASLSPEERKTIRSRLSHLRWDLSEEDADSTDQAHRLNSHDILVAAQTIALDAAREEVLAARSEPDADPEVVDRVLRRLDLRTLLIED